MKRTDLLSALGKIDKTYLDKALERADASEAFCESENNAKVGIMDNRNYIRHKFQAVIAFAFSGLICFGFLAFLLIHNNSLKNKENTAQNFASVAQSTTTALTTTTTISTTTGTTITTTDKAPCASMWDIEPYVSGDKLYFGVCAVDYENPDTDYLLEADVYDADNPGEPIEALSKSCLVQDVPSNVETDVLIDLDYDECPENILIKFTFSTYMTGNYNDEPSTKWSSGFRYNKSDIVNP